MKKRLTLFTLLLLCAGMTWASEPLKVYFGWEYGTYYKKGKQANNPGSTFDTSIAGASNAYCNKWVSADANGTNLTVQYGDGGTGSGTTTENNFNCNTNAFCYGSSCHTVNISVGAGFVITGYVIKGASESTSTPVTVTPAEGGTATEFTSSTTTLTVSGLKTTSTSFEVSATANKYINVEEFYFTVAPITTVEWDTAPSFSPNDNASVYYVGITTPGTASNTYTMTAFSFYENSGYGAAARYTAICTSAPSSATSWKVPETDVLGISNENTTPTAEGYINYTLPTGIDLAGGTTYYMVFLGSNTASSGNYTVGTQRVRLQNSTSYPPTVCLGNGTVRSDLTPGFKATLTTDATYTVNYTCKSTTDNSTITSGSFNDVVATVSAPDLNGYEFSHATTESGDPVDLAQLITSDVNLIFYYTPTYDVTYNLYYQGVLKKSETGKVKHGSIPTLPASMQYPYSTYVLSVTTEITAPTTVNVDVTSTLPFATSTDYDNATWYYLQQHTTYGRYNYTDSSGNGKYTSSNGKTDNYEWAFIGDVFDGFKVINKGTGAGMYMLDGSAIKMDATGTVWSIEEIDATHFCLYNAAETIGDGKYVNSRSAGMGKWYDNSAGSHLWVTLVPNDPYYDDIVALATPFIDAATNHSGEYFQLVSSGTDLMNFGTALNTVEQNHSNNIKSTQADYDNIVTLLNKAIVYPETGYYRIKSSGARTGATYLSYKANISLWSGDSRTGLFTVAEVNKLSDLSTVLFLDRQTDGTYKISSQGMSLQNQTTNNTAFPMTSAEGANFTFRIYTPGVVAITSDFATQGYLHESNWGENKAGVVRWEFGADASHWTVEDAGTISVALHNADDNKAYATFYAPFDATFTGGVTAYTITRGAAIDGVGSEAVMAAVSGAVPAGTPVVLVDETGTVAAATANVSYGAAALGVENILSGHYLASTVADGSLVFGQYNSTPGFYRYDDYTTVLGANRAFIAPAQANNVRAIVFTGSVATGINAATFNANGNAYDLQGRRVQNAQKGLYILNGKKVLVK